MPKGSEELTNARKEEIIDACASLYETMGFKDVTIRDIGARTSFTRTSIYNYFQTKEEIFLVNISLLIQGGTLYPDGSVWLHVLGICIGHVHQARKSNQETHLFFYHGFFQFK